jgi:DNA-binding IclR family transcriptional regulator
MGHTDIDTLPHHILLLCVYRTSITNTVTRVVIIAQAARQLPNQDNFLACNARATAGKDSELGQEEATLKSGNAGRKKKAVKASGQFERSAPLQEDRSGNTVQSLRRGIDVLEIVADSPVPMSCKAVADAANLDRTIVHRLLKTLLDSGLLTAELGRYQLGSRALWLGNAFLDHQQLRRVALPHMLNLLHHGLANFSLATMSLFVPVGRFVTVAEQVWPANAPLDIIMRKGTRLPIDKTAAGRCILAHSSQEDVVQLLGRSRSAELQGRLKSIREANFVEIIGDDEATVAPGMAAISALIRDRRSQPMGALSVSGLGLDLKAGRASPIAQHLRRAADQIGMAVA